MSSLKEIRYEGTKEPKCEEKTFIDTKINKVSVPLQYESRDFCNSFVAFSFARFCSTFST